MRDIQEVFNQMQELKKEQKEIKREYKDALANANEYEEISASLKEIKEKKTQIETITKQRLGSRWEKFEDIKKELDTLGEMVTDIAMATLMDGKTIQIKDQNDQEYEPVYKISFKKIA